ncbi:MAG TPA: nucleotidyltransferase family protein [Burkholderiaceae bacterium]
MQIVGILLAAGRGMRFDASGANDKLMQALPDGERVALASARHLLSVLPNVVAVVRTGAAELATQLRALGCHVEVCATADQGMGASLVCAISQALEADGWIIGLADMPHVQEATVRTLLAALQGGADIVQPTYHGTPGNPVGFSRLHIAQLLQMGGDQGARALLKAHHVTKVAVEDHGILQDIDTPADLPKRA